MREPEKPICAGCSNLLENRLVDELESEMYDGRLWHRVCAEAYRKRERATKRGYRL